MGDCGGMDGFEALRADVDALKRDTAGVRTAVEGLKGVLDGFKESLRAMQWELCRNLGDAVIRRRSVLAC